MFKSRILILSLALLPVMMAFSGCMSAYRQSVGADEAKVYSRIYVSDFNTSWQSVLDALKSNRLDVSNREAGLVQTRWTENTADKNFTDSLGTGNAYLKAQFRFKVNVSKGFYNGKPSIKVTVQKEQMVERDALENWRPIQSDSIEENTLLYRIGRLIYIRMKIARLEEQKTNKAIQDSGF